MERGTNLENGKIKDRIKETIMESRTRKVLRKQRSPQQRYEKGIES